MSTSIQLSVNVILIGLGRYNNTQKTLSIDMLAIMGMKGTYLIILAKYKIKIVENVPFDFED